MKFRSLFLIIILIMFSFMGFTSHASVVTFDLVLDGELEITHVEKVTNKVKVSVECAKKDGDIVAVIDLLASVVNNKPIEHTKDCVGYKYYTSYTVTVKYTDRGASERKIFHNIEGYPGSVGDMFPVRLEVFIKKR